MSEAAQCRNCGSQAAGDYCSSCGQKRYTPFDRTLASLAGDLFASFLNLDNRVWRTFYALMLRPGVLSRDYLDGRRARWLSPVTVFLLVSLVYFLAPPVTDMSLPFRAQVSGQLALASTTDEPTAQQEADYARWQGQLHSKLTTPWVQGLIERRAAAHGGTYGPAEFAAAYDSKNSEISKLIVGLHIPFLAIALAALFPRRDMFFAEHLVVAAHLFCVLVLILEIAAGGARLAAMTAPAVGAWVGSALPAVKLAAGVFLGVSWALAVKRVYGAGRLRSAFASLGLIAAFGAIHLIVFRTVQFVLIALAV